jgi:hypothetical protein
MQRKTRNILFAALICLVCVGLIASRGAAAADNSEFSLQVSPSPLAATLKPGQATTIDLKIRNTGAQPEKLKIVPRSFTIDDRTGELKFNDTKKPEAANWTSFDAPRFTVQPGQWYTEKVTFAVPEDAGFSYSFALVVSRQDAPDSPGPGQQLKGSVAIFTLLTIDRPGAMRQLKLTDVTASQPVYEYLPAELDLTFKNTVNTIVQPVGNVFIQRGSDDKVPVSTLSVNEKNGYILPGSTRTLRVNWDDGFQVLQQSASGGTSEKQLVWNWSNLSHLRIGHYTAKVVAVYNDGQRDVPVVGEVSFWVFPWKLLLGVSVVLTLIGAGLWSFIRMMMKMPKRKKRIRF